MSVDRAVDCNCWLSLRPCLQAVIFIFEHSEQGSAGLILNRPTQYTIGGMPGLETLGPEFGDNVLFLVRSTPAQGNDSPHLTSAMCSLVGAVACGICGTATDVIPWIGCPGGRLTFLSSHLVLCQACSAGRVGM